MSEHNIADLVREINPSTFSTEAHGAGHRIVWREGRATLHAPSFSQKLFGPGPGRHYFVKHWAVPKEISTWQFRWSEGTSAIDLQLQANFVIQANEDTQAIKLVGALQGHPDPGEALYELINANLHRVLGDILANCNRNNKNLLDEFLRSSVGSGECEALNRGVSAGISHALNCLFRVGFQVHDLPLMQIEIRQADEFMLADSKRGRLAETTALLRLNNYQAYKKSGLASPDDVRKAVGQAITQAIKQYLFAKNYFDVVRSFEGKDPRQQLFANMRRHLEKEALTIGYEVRMFQTLPDIAALKLLQPTRIEVSAEQEKYQLANSTSYVQVGILLMVELDAGRDDLSVLRMLIDPDASDITSPIANRVVQICRDRITQYGRMDFNLRFTDPIAPEVVRAIEDGLAEYGLKATAIQVRQAQTEDAQRFAALRARTCPFRLNIKPQTDTVDDALSDRADSVIVNGEIEIVSIAEGQWERFEAKDFGFRQDSGMPISWMISQARKLEIEVPGNETWPIAERQALAIELELRQIRERVTSALEEVLSKIADLVGQWRSLSGSQKIIPWIEKEAQRVIADEFGLTIRLRGVSRQESLSEETARIRHETRLLSQRNYAAEDIAHDHLMKQIAGEHEVKLLKAASDKVLTSLDNEYAPYHEQELAEARKLLTQVVQAPRISSQQSLIRKTTQTSAANLPGSTLAPWDAVDPTLPHASANHETDKRSSD